MNNKAILLNRALQMLAPKPKKVTVYRVQDGPVMYLGKAITDAEYEQLQRTHKVRLLQIVPASQK